MANGKRIRLTKYVVYEYPGCFKKSELCPHALWGLLPDLNDDLSFTQEKQPFYLRLTRQDILLGALEKEYDGAAEPLAWVSEETLFEAMMQGTIALFFPNADKRLFNVHRNNGFPYTGGQSHRQQQRYWYFKSTDAAYGWGKTNKIKLQPFALVSVAGDVSNLGLGKLIWLDLEQTIHLSILANTGGHFNPTWVKWIGLLVNGRPKWPIIMVSQGYPVMFLLEFWFLSTST